MTATDRPRPCGVGHTRGRGPGGDRDRRNTIKGMVDSSRLAPNWRRQASARSRSREFLGSPRLFNWPFFRAAPDWLIIIHPVKSVAPDNVGICHPLSGSPEYWLSQFSTVTNSVITAPAMTVVIFGSGRRWGSCGMSARVSGALLCPSFRWVSGSCAARGGAARRMGHARIALARCRAQRYSRGNPRGVGRTLVRRAVPPHARPRRNEQCGRPAARPRHAVPLGSAFGP
jgi:hypothetical protein